jgi:toxin CptA
VVAALLLLSVLAPFAVLASEMPRPAAWPLALVAAAFGLRTAHREARRPPRRLELPAGAGRALLDGVPLADAALAWRGPLAFLRWRDAAGRRGRLAWWPDTLPPAERRVLKLWSPDGPGMAP